MKHLILVISILCFVSCKKEREDIFFNGINKSKKDIQFNSVDIDTIVFDSIESSYTGFFKVNNDQIHFIDQRFGWIFSFDGEGKLKNKSLGQGKGPNEINTGFIDGYVNLKNGKHVFMGSSFDVHVHDTKYEREKMFTIDWQIDKSAEEIIVDNFDPGQPVLYSPFYFIFNLEQYSDNSVIMPLETNNKYFNGFEHEAFYKNSRIFGELNLETGKITNIFGRKSPEYLNYKYLMAYSMFHFDVDNKKNIYINHEIDSLIYVYNNYESNNYTFGNSGRDMITDYKEINEFDGKKLRHILSDYKPKTSYYTYVEYFEDQDLFFRSYHRPDDLGVDGLQIYKGTVLIADVDVPKNFKVTGYIAPYFYSDAILYEDELKLEAYRIKLPEIK